MVRKSLFLVLLLTGVLWADTGFRDTISITETDGVPKCMAGQIKFSAGTVTCSGQVATVTNTGGGGGGGPTGQINNANQYALPYYSVTGSSNVLSGLAAGTSGQVLTTGGTSGLPFYSDVLTKSSATATYLSQSSATATYFNPANILPVASGGTATATPGLVPGTNITSITGTWPNQTINAATQSGGGGSSSLAVATGTSAGFGVPTSSPTAVIVFDSNTTNGQLLASSTYFYSLRTDSVTLQGNTFNGASQLLKLNSSALISNANIDGSSVTKQGPIVSSVTVNSVGVAQLNFTGTPNNTSFPRGDGIWSSFAANVAFTSYTVGGSTNIYSIPNGATFIKIVLCGGGAAGGAGFSEISGNDGGGSGGGGGACNSAVFSAVNDFGVGKTSFTVIIGTGGIGGIGAVNGTGTSGTAGGASTIYTVAGTTVMFAGTGALGIKGGAANIAGGAGGGTNSNGSAANGGDPTNTPTGTGMGGGGGGGTSNGPGKNADWGGGGGGGANAGGNGSNGGTSVHGGGGGGGGAAAVINISAGTAGVGGMSAVGGVQAGGGGAAGLSGGSCTPGGNGTGGGTMTGGYGGGGGGATETGAVNSGCVGGNGGVCGGGGGGGGDGGATVTATGGNGGNGGVGCAFIFAM